MTCPCDQQQTWPARRIGPGLPAAALRQARLLGAFPQWRRALLAQIGQIPALQDWRAREQYDLGMMLVEMGALVMDGVAFYNALLGQEAYLKSAQFKGGQRRLVEILGYRPRPAMAAEVYLAAQADGVRLLPLAAGAAFRSTAFNSLDGKPQAPQVFELEQATLLEPRLNRLTVDQIEQSSLNGASPGSISSVLVQAGTLGVSTGQAVVLEFDSGSASSTLATAVVSGIRSERLRNKTLVNRVSFASPVSVPANSNWANARMLAAGSSSGLWKLGTAAGESSVISGKTVLLDGRKNLLAGQIVLFECQGSRVARRIDSCSEELRTLLPAQTSTIGSGNDKKDLVSAPVKTLITRITLDSALSWTESQISNITLHHNLGRGGVLLAPLSDQLKQSDSLILPALQDAPRTPVSLLALQDAHGRGVVGSASLTPPANLPGSFSAKLAQSPAWDSDLAAPIQLFGNVFKVSRGESVNNEVLGLGDGSLGQQVFQLKKKPLTYLNDANDTGRRSTLKVWVGGVLWREVPSFYGSSAQDQVYIVRHDEAGNTFITIGGAARLATGVQVMASYRFGAGAASPPAGAVSQIANPIPGLRSVRNVMAASGGADAESASALAHSAPRSALLLKRAISLDDIQALALQTNDVIAARTAWQWDPQGLRPAAVVSYITSAPANAAPEVETALRARLRAAMEDDAGLALKRSLPQTAVMHMVLQVDPRYIASTVVAQVYQALSQAPDETHPPGMLRAERLGPDSVLFLSQLVAAIMAVPGVAGIKNLSLNEAPFIVPAQAALSGHYFDFRVDGDPAASRLKITASANGA